ncbi:phage tail protein [Brenneria uluponensis]|uniref:phage tail protein n=1 Tax=Brenneria uluponensis TaxID=3057057 RepID=UPI0028E71DE1|nr:phage tail protein [Brenneria ulupoensis]
MSTKYLALLTNVGTTKLANATVLGNRLAISQMAVGDGGGTPPTPDPAQTKLINEQRRAALSTLSVDPQNANQIIAEQVIPENEGGWWIREIGLYDTDGDLVAVANCAETYKPQLQEGSGRIQTVRVILVVSSTEAVTLKIDPAVVLATRQYVDNAVIEVKAYADNVLSEHVAAANPHKQYAPINSPALTGTPTAPTPANNDNSKKLTTTEFVANALVGKLAKDQNGADIPDPALFVKNLGLGDAAKLGVATTVQMQAGVATDVLPNVATVMGLFSKRAFATNDYIRIPDVPGGLILQWGTISSGSGGDAAWVYPTPFPTARLCALGTIWRLGVLQSDYSTISLNDASDPTPKILSNFNLRVNGIGGVGYTAFVLALGY